MNSQDLRRLDMLVRVRDFGAAHTAQFPPNTLGGQTFAAIGEAVARLNELAAGRGAAAAALHESTPSRADARKALRQEVEAVLRTVRAIAVDEPGVLASFPPPPSATDDDLLLAARKFAREATPRAADFVKHAMPADFPAGFLACIEQFDRALRQDSMARMTQFEAKFILEDTMRGAFEAVVRLDAIVANTLRGDPTMLGVWQQLRRLDLRPGRKRPAARRSAPPPP